MVDIESVQCSDSVRGVGLGIEDWEADALVEVERGHHLRDEFGVQMEGDLALMEDDVCGGVSAMMAANLLMHHANVMATKKIIFTERWEREHIMRGLKGGLVRAEHDIKVPGRGQFEHQ